MGCSGCEGWEVSATVVLIGVSECEGWVGECYSGVDGCLCCSGCEGWVVSATTVVLMGVSVAVSVRDGR